MNVRLTRDQIDAMEIVKSCGLLPSDVFKVLNKGGFAEAKLKCLEDLPETAIMLAWVAPDRVVSFSTLTPKEAVLAYLNGERLEYADHNGEWREVEKDFTQFQYRKVNP